MKITQRMKTRQERFVKVLDEMKDFMNGGEINA